MLFVSFKIQINLFKKLKKPSILFVLDCTEQLGHQYHHYDVAPRPRATEGLSHPFPT